MRRLLQFLLLIVPLTASSQYVPQSGQNFHFAPVFNPAFTGIENFIDVKAGHRYQWTGFKNNAPQFSNLMFNFRIRQPLDLTSNGLRPSRSDFSNIIPKRKLAINGLGFNLYYESTGPLQRSGVGLHYAIHYPLAERVFLAGGVGAMVEMTRVNGDEFYWGENFQESDPVYEYLSSGGGNHSELWTRAGLLIYGEKFYIGGTYYPANFSLQTSDLAFNRQLFKGNFQAGIAFPLNEDIDLKPSIWGLLQLNGELLIDYNAKFYMQDKVWFGLTYRDINAGVVSGGFNLNTRFSASYSYEFPLGKLRTFAGGSHELILSLRLNNYRNVNQRTW